MRMVLSAVCALACAPALAQEGDVEAGRELAREVCAACHPVGPDAGEAVEPLSLPFEEGLPLAFEDIANAKGVTEAVLDVWLTSTHPTMPDFVLTPEEIRDVVAYILSLKHEGT